MGNNKIWMPVKGYGEKYEVSNEGRVRSLNYNKTGEVKVMKAKKDKNGYLLVNLWKDGKTKTHKVHRLVWEAFRGAIPEGLVINHLDEVKTNNCLSNLEVCTQRENINWGSHNERAAKNKTNHPSLSKQVHQIDKKTGEVINTYPSAREAERQTGIYHSTIAKCCLNRPNFKSAGGYLWQYVEEKGVV